MKTVITCIALCFCFSLFSQQKGVTPISDTGIPNTQSRTYAVVVGISDYQDEDIPDLRFANKDAEAFASFLQSPSGGNLPPENLQILTDKAATTGAIASAMDWLIADCKAGDRAIIYFSGHGDVETRTRFQRGFLLTYDSPPTNYLAGAFALIFLQDIITTLSEQGVQVVMVSDACRAGKLAGSDIGGAQATAANLSKQYANEIKILSCQPDEFSLEGEQWGGGRGAFSYHLIDALTGMADRNTDQKVNLLEIGQYLQMKVPAETDPHSQIPLMVGSMKTVLANVDEGSLSELRQRMEKELPALANIETKGFEEVLLAKVDSIWQKKYEQFTAALKKGELLPAPSGEPADESAYDLYQELSQVEGLERLQGIIKRNLAAALQEESQQAINAYLRADNEELAARSRGELKYSKFIRYLEKAAELLGEGHYMYNSLKAKQYYFEAVDIRVRAANPMFSGVNPSEVWKKKWEVNAKKAVELEPNAAYVHNELSQWKATDNKMKHFIKAIELAPNWAVPYNNMAVVYRMKKEYEKSILYSKKALELKPGYSFPYMNMGDTYRLQQKYEKADEMYAKTVEVAPGNVDHLSGIASYYMTQNRYEEAEKLYLNALAYTPKNLYALSKLAWIHFSRREWEKAHQLLDKSIALLKEENQKAGLVYTKALFYFYSENFDEAIALTKQVEEHIPEVRGLSTLLQKFREEDYNAAESILLKFLKMEPNNAEGNHLLCRIKVKQGKLKEAIEPLSIALKGIPYDFIKNDEQLAPLREVPKYKKLMRQQSQK